MLTPGGGIYIPVQAPLVVPPWLYGTACHVMGVQPDPWWHGSVWDLSDRIEAQLVRDLPHGQFLRLKEHRRRRAEAMARLLLVLRQRVAVAT